MNVFAAKRRSIVNSRVWLTVLAILASFTWLIPNHFRPWTSFHADAWISVIGLVGSGAAVWRHRRTLKWRPLSSLVALLVPLPWLQFASGLLPFSGQAWITAAYLIGLLLAMLIGAHWEGADSENLDRTLFIAIGIAATVSVGLQFYTWLSLWEGKITDIWSMGSSGDRPYANVGQPNNLATLLTWGLLAFFWTYQKQIIGSVGAVLAAAFLLSGMALTQSRAGLLELTVLLAAVWHWRKYWISGRTPWVASILFICYLVCPWLLNLVHDALLLGPNEHLASSLIRSGGKRLEAWQLFLSAIMERPWMGYGWTKVTVAQAAMADQFPTIGEMFGEAHNLFLDLMLWTGVPIGVFISGFLIRWFWTRFKAIRRAEDAVVYLVLAAVGVHSMVEYPLYYAYFLLPTGLLMGVLDARLACRPLWQSPRWVLMVLWLIAAVAFGITVRDYFRVESTYSALRFEQARIGLGKTPPVTPPDVLALTQLREWIRAAKFVPHLDMSAAEFEWLETVTQQYPVTPFVYRLAKAYALNGQPGKAAHWLLVNCRIAGDESCRLVHQAWLDESKASPQMATVQAPFP